MTGPTIARSCRCGRRRQAGGCSSSRASEVGLTIATVGLAEGGRLGLCRLPGAGGELAADLRAIAAWRPELVVSLTTGAELAAAGCDGLGAALAAARIGWRHLPVEDFAAPDKAGDAAWPVLAEELHAALDAGRAVLLHCRGGIGRSGMITLRLLVERGEAPAAALRRLRAVRPGAVETEAQLAWASAGRAGG